MVCVITFLEPTWSLFLSSHPYDLVPSQIGLTQSVLVLSLALSLPLAGELIHYVGALTQIGVGCVCTTCGMLMFGPSPLLSGVVLPSMPSVLCGLILIGIGGALSLPACPPVAVAMLEKHGITQQESAGSLAAVTSVVHGVGGLLGPLLASVLPDALGYPSAFTTMGCVLGLAAAAQLPFYAPYASPPSKGCLAARAARVCDKADEK